LTSIAIGDAVVVVGLIWLSDWQGAGWTVLGLSAPGSFDGLGLVENAVAAVIGLVGLFLLGIVFVGWFAAIFTTAGAAIWAVAMAAARRCLTARGGSATP